MSEPPDARPVDHGSSPSEPGTGDDERIRADERLRLARELHDGVGSGLTTIQVQAEAAAILLRERPDEALEALLEIKRMTREALAELRAILGMMRSGPPGPVDRGPDAPRIGALASATTRAGVATHVIVSGEPRGLPPEVRLAAWRIVQESLANVLRHSGASAASVRVAYERDRVLVEVEDDGLPDAHPSASTPHHGILGMRERASALGGDLNAGPRPHGGFAVRARLPMHGAG